MGLVDHFLLDLCLNRFTTRFIDDKDVELLKRLLSQTVRSHYLVSLVLTPMTYVDVKQSCNLNRFSEQKESIELLKM
jgi:hypothetical protein